MLACFYDPSDAWVQVERLGAHLLPAAMASSPMLVELSQLDAVLGAASWRSFVTMAINTNAGVLGRDLVDAMLLSQNDIVAPGAGGGGTAATPAAGGAAVDTGASFGSIRDSALADALRQDGTRDALAEAISQAGVERVETFMTSGSTILLRAMLLQESWLQNRAAALSCCAFDAPYLCPFVASYLIKDGGPQCTE